MVVLDPRTGNVVQIRIPPRPQSKPATQNIKLERHERQCEVTFSAVERSSPALLAVPPHEGHTCPTMGHHLSLGSHICRAKPNS